MVFEAHCMSFPCTELLLFNYAKVNTVFHSMAPLKTNNSFLFSILSTCFFKKTKKLKPCYVYCVRLTETCHNTCMLLLFCWF